MSCLGLAWVTAISTVCCAFLSMLVAWLFGFIIDVPNYHVHILLAFIIPFFVSPPFSYLTALSMRDLQRARRCALELAEVDALTGIANRRAFFEAVQKRVGTDPDAESATSQGVLFIDIDHFKKINDRYGHEAGDAVIKDFAQLLRASTRTSDLIARVGGEEFVFHAIGVEPACLAAVGNGLLAHVRTRNVTFRGEYIRYTVSIGAAIGAASTPVDCLLSFADRALYAVKNAGRNGYHLADTRTEDEPKAAAAEAQAQAAPIRVRRATG